MAWTTDDIPDLSGRTAIVTGANTGIGFETAAALAAKGARTVLACRDAEKAEASKHRIQERSPDAEVETLILDLGNLEQIAGASIETTERFETVDILINNAGVMTPPKMETADGFELQFGTNHLGHFAFTGGILPLVLAADAGRIVTVSSIAHKSGKMRWDDLQWEEVYNRTAAYGQSKLANLLFAFTLQRRLAASSAPAVSIGAHPGVSPTELMRHIPILNLPLVKPFVDGAMSLASQPPAAGALPSLRAAVDPDADGGEYYGPDGMSEMWGAPVLVRASGLARDEKDGERLWKISEALTGVHYDLPLSGS